MTNPTFSAATSFGRALALWLATIGLGTFFIGLFLLMVGSPELEIALIAGAMAGGFSLPVLLLLPFGIRRALAGATPEERGWRLFGFITLLFGLATLVCYVVFHEADLTSTIFGFAAPYFVAALLTTYFLYRDWLSAPLLASPLAADVANSPLTPILPPKLP